jgi:hypothetical protein
VDRRILIAFAALLLPLVLAGCPTTEEYEQLNEAGECFEVVISPDEAGDDDDSGMDDDDSAMDDDDSAGDDDDLVADDDDAVDMDEIDLHARAGWFDIDVIGAATLSPSRGPAGTRFELVVVLEDTGTEESNPVEVVTRATVLVDNGAVSINEFDLRESPADERRWSLVVEAGGTEETRRTDLLCVALYTEI